MFVRRFLQRVQSFVRHAPPTVTSYYVVPSWANEATHTFVVELLCQN